MTLCTLRINDEANCVFLGLKKDDYAMLREKYAFNAPGYFFNPLYKLGRWDGKIDFFTLAGKTYNFLIEEIVPVLMKKGYKINVDDLRTATLVDAQPIDENHFSRFLHPKTGKPIIFRDDQVNAINALILEGNGICLAATSAGKTLCCAAICDVFGKLGIRTLTIVPDQTLIRQTKADYKLVELDPGEYSGDEKTYEKQHVVSTWQALKNNPKIILDFGLVIVDESHGLKGPVLKEILIKHCVHIPYRFGFTGTLPKDPSDAMCVHIATGPVRCTITAAELMAKGAIAQLHIDMVQLVEDMKDEYKEYLDELAFGKPLTYTAYKEQYFPDFSSEKSYLSRNNTRIQWIADFLIAKRENNKGNTLCLVDSIPLARKLGKLIPNSYVVNGQDTKKVSDRTDIYEMFETRDDMIVIATVNVAGTGLSINRIFNLVLVDIGKAFTRVIQSIGRGLRISEDKKSILVTDICSDLKYSKKHLKLRKNYYDEATYKYKHHKIEYLKTKELIC